MTDGDSAWQLFMLNSLLLKCFGSMLQVSDTKPKRPQWPLMSGASEAITTAVAGWGHIVLLGDAEGNLSRWDTLSGKVSTIPSTQARI
jgi:hypothetical protein